MVASIELQRTIYSSLSSAYKVFEIMPSDYKLMPFITLSEINKQTNFTKTNTDRYTFSISIHGWTKGQSSLESKQIEELIYQTIMNLEMTTYDVEFVDLTMNVNTKEEESKDSNVFHSVQQFEITISKIEE